jgi:hypothetical protein
MELELNSPMPTAKPSSGPPGGRVVCCMTSAVKAQLAIGGGAGHVGDDQQCSGGRRRFLSLWLAVLRLLETRPVIVLEWVVRGTGHQEYGLRIRNTSRYPIHIGEVRKWLPWTGTTVIKHIRSDGWKTYDAVVAAQSRRLDVYIAEGEEEFLPFEVGEEELSRLLLAVYWYRHQPILLPTFPKLPYRSKRRLDQLRAHPIRRSV